MSIQSQKPRVCIALPGIHYLPHTTYVLNTRPLIPHLQEDFDITLVFRKNLETPEPDARYLTILDQAKLSAKEVQNKEPYFAPTDPLRAWRYITVLDKFAQEHAKEFDFVLERQWSLVGALSSAFLRFGVPSVFIVEAEFYNTTSSKDSVKQVWQSALDQILPHLRRRWMQQAGSIIVETDQMKSFLFEQNYLNPSQPVYSIPNGIDPTVFFPQDRDFCRQKLGINKDTLVLTYVGSLRRFIQDPALVIEALGREQPKDVVLHIVGDGTKRTELEAIAQQFDAPVVFHGRMKQTEAALYIAAADVCIAPYNKYLFPDNNFTSASIKVCEYLGCGRPVLTIPCERMEHLLDGGKYGFLVENEVESYREFFRNLPSREEFSKKENAIISDMKNLVLRDKGILLTWCDLAEKYKKVIYENLSK